MNIIANKKSEKVLSSYRADSEANVELRIIRAREKRDAILFTETQQMLTVKGMRENQYYRIYENSFSRSRNRFDECGRVSLTSKNRAD